MHPTHYNVLTVFSGIFQVVFQKAFVFRDMMKNKYLILLDHEVVTLVMLLFLYFKNYVVVFEHLSAQRVSVLLLMCLWRAVPTSIQAK